MISYWFAFYFSDIIVVWLYSFNMEYDFLSTLPFDLVSVLFQVAVLQSTSTDVFANLAFEDW